MSIYVRLMDRVHQDKKNNMAGQMTLFDIVSDEEKESFDIRLPDVGEYSKEMKLAFEKEVLGIYISGHPLEEYEAMWRKKITAKTADFLLDEESGSIKVADGSSVTIGGMIAGKKIKYTKNDKVMAFLQVEDLVGSVEVIVFPKDYEKNSAKLIEDAKVFIKGRVSAEEEKDGKLICEAIMTFDEEEEKLRSQRKLWVKFPDKETYQSRENELFEAIAYSDGKNPVGIFIENPKAVKILPSNRNVKADQELLDKLAGMFGTENVKIV